MTDTNAQLIFLSNARISWPNLAEPQKNQNPDGSVKISYNCNLILEPNDPGFQKFMQLYATMAQAEWKAIANQVMQAIHADKRLRCYGSGEEVVNSQTMQVYDGYVGKVYLKASKDQIPQVIDGDGRPIDPANTMAVQQTLRRMYGGCRVNAAVRPWLQDNKFGRGVRLDLVAVQFAGDDTPFGEAVVDASGLFGAVAGAQPAFAPVATPAMPPLPFAQPGMPSFLK